MKEEIKIVINSIILFILGTIVIVWIVYLMLALVSWLMNDPFSIINFPDWV